MMRYYISWASTREMRIDMVRKIKRYTLYGKQTIDPHLAKYLSLMKLHRDFGRAILGLFV